MCIRTLRAPPRAVHPLDCRTSSARMPYLDSGHEWPDRAARRARVGSRARCSGRASARGRSCCMSGEAGVGKTRLAAELAAGVGRACVLRGAPSQGGAAPVRPGRRRAAQLPARASRRRSPSCGPLRAHLALLLPELGEPAPAADRPTLFEAMRCALAHVAAERHALVVLDDLHWSDEATLELLSALAEPLGELPVLVIAAYRSDGLPRDHGVRRLRNDLRRTGRLDELVLRPLALEETAELLAQALGEPPSPPLARAIHDRTEGLPFFVEELAAALRVSGAVQSGRRGLELSGRRRRPAPGHRARRGADQRRPSCPRRRARPPRSRPSRASRSTSSWWPALSSDDGLSELLERGAGARGSRRARPRSATGSRARRCTPTSRGCGGARCTARSPRRSRPPARRAARSRRHWLGARDGARAREALLRAAARVRGGPRLPRRRRGGPPGARAVARERRRGAARRGARALRALLARWPASWPRPRAPGASWPPSTAPRGDELALARRAARARRGARAQGRPRGGVRRAARRRRGLRRQRPPGRGRGRAAGDGQPAPPGRAARRGDRARAGRARAGRGRRPRSTCGSARSGSRAWRPPSTATTSAGSRPCAAASRSRSSTT